MPGLLMDAQLILVYTYRYFLEDWYASTRSTSAVADAQAASDVPCIPHANGQDGNSDHRMQAGLP